MHAQVGGNLGAAARLHGDGGGLLEQLGTAMPEVRVHEIPAVYPADNACGGADLHVFVVAGGENPVMRLEKKAQLVAVPGGAAPQRDAARPGVNWALRIGVWAVKTQQ